MWHRLSAEIGTNFADKRRLLHWYSSLANSNSSHGFLSFFGRQYCHRYSRGTGWLPTAESLPLPEKGCSKVRLPRTPVRGRATRSPYFQNGLSSINIFRPDHCMLLSLTSCVLYIETISNTECLQWNNLILWHILSIMKVLIFLDVLRIGNLFLSLVKGPCETQQLKFSHTF
jgi:hypothetical protein